MTTTKEAQDIVPGVPQSAISPLVKHLRLLAHAMISHRKAIGVDRELQYCKDVINNSLTCADNNALEYEKTIDQSIDGVTAGKRDDAISVHTDLIISQLNKLYTIKPTPVPSLPRREEDVVVDKVEELILARTANSIADAQLGYMERLAENGVVAEEDDAMLAVKRSGVRLSPSEDEIVHIAKKMKTRAASIVNRRATLGAKRLDREIHDILVETGAGDELLKSIDDFDSYPYTVVRTGSHLPFARRMWKKNRWVVEDQELPVLRRISPHDFYWSPDSLTINDGEAVGDVLHLKRSDLERMYQFEKLPQIKIQIKDALNSCNSFESWRGWLDMLGHKGEIKEEYTPWTIGVTVPCFRLHALLDACALKEMGIKQDGGLVQYEVEAWLLNEAVIRFRVHDPKGYRRPYAMEKFRHIPGRFEGQSLAKILKPIEHQVRSIKRNMILNIGFSSAPITVRDIDAFKDTELPDVINPGDNIDARSRAGKTIKPVDVVIYPNITAQLRQVLVDLYSEADIKSQIPRVLLGQGSVSSSLRSASMLATQIAGASKNLKRQLWFYARNVIVPYIDTVFQWYMENGSDETAKVDATVDIGSIEALVNREFVLQQSKELVQYLGQYVSSGQVSGKVINQLLFNILSESGITAGDDPELAEEFDALMTGVTGMGTPQAQGVALDGRSDFQALTGQTLQGGGNAA